MINSQDKEKITNLMEKDIPSYRQAYSDRTAWIMACLSGLSYLRFNPLFSSENHKQVFRNSILKLVAEAAKITKDELASKMNNRSIWSQLIDQVSYDSEKEKEILISNLKNLNFELLETFDEDGTQAILVKSNKGFIVLAFRGTETTSWRDIKSDLDAFTLKLKNGEKVHQGFQKAFEKVFPQIEKTLQKEAVSQLPLFVTGHSLGGALAIVAAKNIQHKGGIAACYTFGSPRVGNTYWFDSIKAPIYRIVNSADMVPTVPCSGSIINTIEYMLPFLRLKPLGKWIQSKFGGYYHGGDMRYLTNCPAGNYEKVRLLNHYGVFQRVFRRFLTGRFYKLLGTLLSDHNVKVYREKLLVIALRRNT